MHNRYLQLFQEKVQDQINHLKVKAQISAEKMRSMISAYWFKSVMLGIVIWMFLIKDVNINLKLMANPDGAMIVQTTEQSTIVDQKEIAPQNTSNYNKSKKKTAVKTSGQKEDDNLMNTYSNLPFDGKNTHLSESEKKRAEKKRKQLAYVKKYKNLARQEMKTHGIPASITLAQGLLESNAGESRLAVNNHNHFGLKCFSRKCKKGHCTNFTDDSHKDFFKKFNDPVESYKAHSYLLKTGSRYNSLFKLKKTDYKGWARGLRKAGYATDPKYDKKLISLIERLKLHKYDK